MLETAFRCVVKEKKDISQQVNIYLDANYLDQ
jgi:hypothetical protein